MYKPYMVKVAENDGDEGEWYPLLGVFQLQGQAQGSPPLTKYVVPKKETFSFRGCSCTEAEMHERCAGSGLDVSELLFTNETETYFASQIVEVKARLVI